MWTAKRHENIIPYNHNIGVLCIQWTKQGFVMYAHLKPCNRSQWHMVWEVSTKSCQVTFTVICNGPGFLSHVCYVPTHTDINNSVDEE
jgi:hypothetical protein